MLRLKDVRKVYDGKARVVALDGVSLSIGAGEMVAVMGPSGSGKSTLLNLMGGLDVPTSGALLVAGEDLAAKSEEERSLFRRTHVSYVFQSYHLMPTLSAAQNVELPLHLAGRKAGEARERALRTLEEVGLAARSTHLPDELSGGERQRVAIARALVTGAPLLLADEPTGNLDTAKGEEILQLLKAIHEVRGTTIVMVTHDPHAAAACERVVTFRDGSVVEDTRG